MFNHKNQQGTSFVSLKLCSIISSINKVVFIKKKISTLLALAFLVANFLPIPNIFAADDPNPVMSLHVNDYKHVFIGEGDQADFTATLHDIEEPYSNVTWSYNTESGTVTAQTPVNASKHCWRELHYDRFLY